MLRHGPVKSRKSKYAVAGAALAAGAPLGWLLLRMLRDPSGFDLQAELLGQAFLYGYLAIGTAAAFGIFGLVLGATADRLAAANAELSELALSDELTGLKNSRYFNARLREECSRADREDRPLALITADLDRFKLVNDRLGHPVGDEVLLHAARALLDGVRTSDSVCRIGGEEFVIVCPGTTLEQAYGMAERIRVRLQQQPARTVAGEVSVTASFGVAVLAKGAAPCELRSAADAALYAAKNAGRNRVERASQLQLVPRVAAGG